ncbi:MAG: pyruvate ferredoxin oxidoreductase [Desulfobacterota bacterium]|nr:pyruvate ferredoxin oxidoreductase [Thermodesulfobacteriota bacterium]MDW8001092.1 transketolase C-terminal domain-containing protein [Deltaproteobacteria bacterium]
MKRVGIEVSAAIAEAAKLARVEVISAYPITPQTHIVERLAELVADGELEAVYMNVESEHSALSACVGAAAAGARTFTSTSAQGLELMHEILFIASSLRLPIVMVLVNRALSAPLSIWCDHSDVMAARDCGWIMLFCENGQEAVDSVIMAYRIAEDRRVLLPVMVNIDGFTLSHVIEPVEFPEQELVDSFLPPYNPLFTLNPERPVTMGAYGMPEIYTEAKYAQEMAIKGSKAVVKEVMEEFGRVFGRRYNIIETYNLDGAESAFFALGTINENIKTAIDALREKGKNIGLISLRLFRPFPSEELIEILKNLKRLMVIERAMPQGAENTPLFNEISSLAFHNRLEIQLENYIAGLGGRDVDPQEFITIATNPFQKDGKMNYKVIGVRG